MSDVRIGFLDDSGKPTEPLPSQAKFLSYMADPGAKRVCFIGGFGSGKTQSLCLAAIMEMVKWPKNRGVLCRKFMTELKTSTLVELEKLLPRELILDWNRSENRITFANGSVLHCIGLDEAGKSKIRSMNLGGVFYDELSECDEPTLLELFGRLRRKNASRRFYAATNSAGHDAVVWKHFIGPEADKGSVHVLARTAENHYLPPSYIADLRTVYPIEWQNRFLECSFSDFEGLVYSEFQEARNREDENYEPRDSDELMFVLDWGYRVPCAIGLFATDYDNKTHLYRTYYKAGGLVKDIAAWLKAQSGFKRATLLADPSIKGVERDGRSVYDDFSDLGVDFDLANNNRPQGYQRVNQWLRDGGLVIGPQCSDWFTEQASYKWKDRRPGEEKSEEAVKAHDHLMDVTRYAANHIELPKAAAPDTVPAFWKQLMAEEEASRNKHHNSAGAETYSSRFAGG